MMASAPIATSASMSSVELTVQTFTANPRSWAALTSSGVTEDTKGWTAREPASAARSTAACGSPCGTGDQSSASANLESATPTATSVSTWNEETMTRSRQPASSMAAAVSAATAWPGS